MTTASSTRETDYLIIGAGAMGMAFADTLNTLRPDLKITIVERRSCAGGHWNDAYPFVRLHQPAAFYGVNSQKLGNGTSDLSSKTEILAYYAAIVDRFQQSDRIEFLSEHSYLGNHQVAPLSNPNDIISYTVNERLVDATYMNVEVPSTHAPKFTIDEGVNIAPLNDLVEQHHLWEQFFVIGSGKTGMDAVLYLLDQGVAADNIYWVIPNDAWMFNRDHIQIGNVGKEVLQHAAWIPKVKKAEDIFLAMEKGGGIMRLDESTSPKKWRCATINPRELAALRTIKKTIRKGRVNRITTSEVQLQNGNVSYAKKTLFVNCSADGLAKRPTQPIFTDHKITLQSVLFCQQVFSAAAITKLALTNVSDSQRNKLVPVPHPELKEEWPTTLSMTLTNLLLLHRFFPMWMYKSRLNFMSHGSMAKYFFYAGKALILNKPAKRAAARMGR